jgi:hypothetical protein
VLAGGQVVRDRAQVRFLGRVAIDHHETARTRRVPIERGGHHWHFAGQQVHRREPGCHAVAITVVSHRLASSAQERQARLRART